MEFVNQIRNQVGALSLNALIQMGSGALTATYLYRPCLITPMQGAIFTAGKYICAQPVQSAIIRLLNADKGMISSIKKLILIVTTIFAALGPAYCISLAMGCPLTLSEIIVLDATGATVFQVLRAFLNCIGF